MLATMPLVRPRLRRPGPRAIGGRPLLIGLVGGGLLLFAIAAPTRAADPSASPTPAPSQNPAADPATPSPPPEPPATPSPVPTATPDPTPDPTASPAPTPSPDPTPPPTPIPVVAPASIDLYVSTGFRYQDPNYSACTSTSAMIMLNFIRANGSGGTDFRWNRSLSGTKRDSMLSWERRHDTLPGGTGSDPNGWRNALNYYGWGPAALTSPGRVYDDAAYPSYAAAIKAAVRAIASTHKPVGLLSWQGHHAQVITGYFGLVGDPFSTDANGVYTNSFVIGGVYISDVLSSDRMRHIKVGYRTLQYTTNYRLRFRLFTETDSTRDDAYTVGWARARDEWYRRYVVILPLR
jgi:hypothetical protein